MATKTKKSKYLSRIGKIKIMIQEDLDLIKELKQKIQILDQEEQEIGREFERGLWKTEKRKRQKNCIRCLYMTKLYAFLGVLSKLGGEDDFVKEIWDRRKKHFEAGSDYGKLYRKLKTKDYPQKSFIEL